MYSLPFPKPKVKVEDSSDVIDLVEDRSPVDLVYEWHSKVRTKIKNHSVESEGSLDTLMKWYIELLKEEAAHLVNCQALREVAAKHIQFFKLYFVELNCCFINDYLDNMEEILAFYLKLEIDSLSKKGSKREHKKELSSVCRRINFMLNLYLLYREDRIYHVVMKIKLNLLSEESKELLNLFYGKLLTIAPKDKSELGFCRAYILYQMWKTIRKPNDWKQMDEHMYQLYDRTPEYVKTNETLKRILLPQNKSVVATLTHITEHTIISQEYFKFISSMKNQEEDVTLPDINDIEISDPTLPGLETDDEGEEFHKAYNNFVKSMSALSQGKSNTVPDECPTVKLEDEDDDCQIVEVSSVTCDSEDDALVHEICDDDMEMLYIQRKKRQSATQKEKNGVSFLDSIEIPEHSEFQSESAPSAADVLTGQTSMKNVIAISTSPLQHSTSTSLHSPVQNPGALKTSTTVSNPEKKGTASSPLNSNNDIYDVNMEIDTDSISRVMKPLSYIKENPSKYPVRSELLKTVTNMETQTDKIPDDNISERSCECLYNLYGLVTPPSDQPSDEQSTHPTDGNACPNVYANIIRSHDNLDEADSSGKTSEDDYLAEESNLDDSMKNFRTISEFDKSLEQQGMCTNNEDPIHLRNENSNMSFETVSESDLKLKAKAGHSPKCSSDEEYEEDDCMNQYNSIPDKMVTTEETIVDSNEKRESTSKNFSINSTAQINNLDLVGEVEKLPDLSTSRNNDIFRSHPSSSPYNPSGDRDSSPNSSPSKSCAISKILETSRKIPYTSDHLIVTSQDCPTSSNTISNAEVEPLYSSPDIINPSDMQDFNKENGEIDSYCVEKRELCATDQFLKENDCSELYLGYSESNAIEGFVDNSSIENPILMNNGGELPFIRRKALAVGANINIYNDNHFDESSAHSNVPSPTNNLYDYEIERPQAIKEIEEVDGEVSKHNHVPSSPSKELKVDKEKENVSYNKCKINNEINARKIMCTSEKGKQPLIGDSSKLQLCWNTGNGINLDEIFNGPISKVNGVNSSVNPDINFDLFNAPSVISEDHTPQISPNCISTSGEVNSPAYEGMDDFRTFYEENKNNGLRIPSAYKLLMEDKVSNKTSPEEKSYVKINSDKAAIQPFSKHLKTVRDNKVGSDEIPGGSIPTDNDGVNLPKAKHQNKVKRLHIAFAENVTDSSNGVSHSPTENSTVVPQSILKKTSSSESEISKFNDKRTTRPRIPLDLMNLKSLARYGVKSDDACLQGVPCVPIERLGSREVEQWLKMSEETRKYKEMQEALRGPTMLTVNYDKQTSQINENDKVLLPTQKGITSVPLLEALGNWRPKSILHTKSTGLDEGLKSNDLPYTQKENGKRKRQGSISDSPQPPKKPRVFRAATENSFENAGLRRSGRSIKKPEKDYDVLIKSGRY